MTDPAGLLAVALALLATTACTAGDPTDTVDAAPPVPWLIIDPAEGYRMAQYGYRDLCTGKMTIPVTWGDARPFQNGFAVVAQLHTRELKPNYLKYGVIDAHGHTVIAPKYDSIELVTRGPLTLAFLRQQYNAWWRFWQWHSFSLLSTSPITRVLRDHWRVVTLPEQKPLLSARLDYTRSTGFGYHRRYGSDYDTADGNSQTVLPFALNVAAPSDLIGIGRQVFLTSAKGTVTHLTGDLALFTQDGGALVRTRGGGDSDDEDDHSVYELISSDGHRMARRFTRTTALTFKDTHGVALAPTITRDAIGNVDWFGQFGSDANNGPGNFWTTDQLRTPDLTFRFPFVRQRGFYRDEHGRTYLAPKLRTPLPATLADYVAADGAFTARDIIQHLRALIALPHGMGFLVVEDDDFAQPGRVFVLMADGHWNPKAPAFLRGPTRVFANGSTVFVGPDSRGILMPDLRFVPTPLASTAPISGHPDWYVGQDAATRKYGIYDAARRRWQVPAHYDYIAGMLAPGVAVYRTDTTVERFGHPEPVRHFGLLDIKTGRAITPPRYDFVDTDGRVGEHRPLVNSYDVKLDPGFAFYLNLHTGTPYLTQLKLNKQRQAQP